MSKEAMKLALEALEDAHHTVEHKQDAIGRIKAITALREALDASLAEQPAQQEPEYKGWYCTHCQRGVDSSEVTYHEQHTVCGRVITDDLPPSWDSWWGNNEQPAQQKPVAHRDDFWCADLTCKKCYSADFRFKHKNSVVNESLTTSAQRTWVDLTDEEIMAIGQGLGAKCRFGGNPNIEFDYARAIEAKLKEKNT